MGLTAADYLQQLQALLPPGAACTREPGSFFAGLLSGLAEELARVDGRAEALLAQIDPRTADELLADWEELLGLPDVCAYSLLSTPERRAAAYTRLTAPGGASRQYFIDLAAAYGYPGATIDESIYDEALQPATCNSTCNDYLWTDTAYFEWTLNLPGSGGSFVMGCNDTCNDYLQVFGEPSSIECRINQVKPAHTYVYFAYAEGPG